MPIDSGRAGGAWSWEAALRGVIPPSISPLTGSGHPDEGATGALVEHVLAGGCRGLFVLGGCGEGAWLSGRQRGAVVRAACAVLGIGNGLPAAPFAPASDDQRRAITAVLERHRRTGTGNSRLQTKGTRSG